MFNRKYNYGRGGFTVIELMTVVAIIVILIGILVPGIRGVKRIAKNLEQKSLFHSIDIGLNLYKKDFGDYPDSEEKINGSMHFTGAQHLAEAMVGRDEKGFESSQSRKWNWPGMPSGTDLYTDDPKSISRRKPVYVNLKETGAYIMKGELYDDTYAGNVISIDSTNTYRAPVLTDVFQKKKINTINNEKVKIGGPVLYFKADTGSKLYTKNITTEGPADFKTWIYNYEDNRQMLDDGAFFDLSQNHQYDAAAFYKSIADVNVSFDRPQNSSTFLLISAGYDGIFGTKDDVTNMKD